MDSPSHTDTAAEYTQPAFEAWPEMQRWKRVSVTITEKIDGTNAQIYIPSNPEHPVLAGSRTRWIGPTFGTDNFGFGAWVAEHAELLRRLGPGRHYGEWWGAGIQRRYGLDHKRFSLFNVRRFSGGVPQGLPDCVGTVPVLYQGSFDPRAIDKVIAKLYLTGSRAAPGWSGPGKAGPEGVVIQADNCPPWKLTDNGDASKGRQHHVEATLGTVDVVWYSFTTVKVQGPTIADDEHVFELVPHDATSEEVESARYRVASRIVDVNSKILEQIRATGATNT